MDIVDVDLHTFRSREFQGVVEAAVRFLEDTPVYYLPPPSRFTGCGVYAFYYLGDFELYAKLIRPNEDVDALPIYIGKAVPPGWRAARATSTETGSLYGRLREHARSIQQARNLEVHHFRCRFIILRDAEIDLIVPVEAALIRNHRPLWNSVVDGFGNHNPGKGRYNQAKSEWDVLHPGRPWADRLTGASPSLEETKEKTRDSLNQRFLSSTTAS